MRDDFIKDINEVMIKHKVKNVLILIKHNETDYWFVKAGIELLEATKVLAKAIKSKFSFSKETLN